MVCKKKNNVEIRYIAEMRDVPKDFLLTEKNRKFKNDNLSVDDLAYYNYQNGLRNLNEKKGKQITKGSVVKTSEEKQTFKMKIKNKLNSLRGTNKEDNLQREETSLEKLEKMVKQEFRVFEQKKDSKVTKDSKIAKDTKNKVLKDKEQRDLLKEEHKKEVTKNSLKNKLKNAFSFKKKAQKEERASEDAEYLLNQTVLKQTINNPPESSTFIRKKSMKTQVNAFFKKIHVKLFKKNTSV